MDEVLEMILSVLKDHVSSAILFGSRAKETATDRSDYDIAVSGVVDYDKLLEEVDNIDTLYSVDIINLDECNNKLLVEDVEKYGTKIL
ncbi:MAG: nucleotidyltransferase domain-containing protein [Lachnospiraceae bacterium]